jgi:sulfite reductase alpha subunit-like flavoprotein
VDDALNDICQDQGVDWRALKPQMRAAGRYHVETY